MKYIFWESRVNSKIPTMAWRTMNLLVSIELSSLNCFPLPLSNPLQATQSLFNVIQIYQVPLHSGSISKFLYIALWFLHLYPEMRLMAHWLSPWNDLNLSHDSGHFSAIVRTMLDANWTSVVSLSLFILLHEFLFSSQRYWDIFDI